MGRSKKGRAANSDWEDGSVSSMSTCTTLNEACDTVDDSMDKFQSAMEDLFEKRGSTREKALTFLVKYLREDVRESECMQNETTLISRCINGIRRGSNTEAVLACQLLGLHLMTLPEPQESHFREAQFDLQTAAASGETVEVRVAGVDSLAMCCYVAAEHDQCCLEVMERLRGMWSSRETRSASCALRGWALLFTRLNRMLVGREVEGVLAQLAQLLHAENIEVRSAAGEVLALLYHCCNLKELLSESMAAEEALPHWLDEEDEQLLGEEEEEEHAAEADQQAGLGEVVQRMRQLASSHQVTDQRRLHKREKAAMRGTFRGVMALVERGQVPTNKIKLQYGDVLLVDTMEGNTLLGAVKRFLAGGFQVHLQRNPHLHAWFDFTPRAAPPGRMSALEKRHLKSPSSADSKWRTATRQGDRAFKANRTSGYADDD